MQRILTVSLTIVLVLALTVSVTFARKADTRTGANVRYQDSHFNSRGMLPDRTAGGMPAVAVQETTVLATYTFDSGPSCVREGWVSIDGTAQLADFFHVAQATGGTSNELDGGDFGLLIPLQGNKSLWCGGTANHATTPSGAMCGYAAMPGYGNAWNQALCTKTCLSVGTDVSMTFLVTWDTEWGYDGTTVEVDECDDNWIPAGAMGSPGGHFDGTGVDSLHTHDIPDSLHSGALRIRFHMVADGAWSDEDGLWDTDGAILIDSLSVSDNSGLVLAVEDFETEAEGATSVTDWEACTPPGYGDFSGLFHGFTLVDEDPCVSNLSCMWGFFNSAAGPVPSYACGGFPGQDAMPYGNARGQFLNVSIQSPKIPWVGTGATAVLHYEAYSDLPLDNLQFYTWGIASVVDGCTGTFRDRNFVYFGDGPSWAIWDQPVGDLISPGTTDVVIRLGAVDMCSVWCGTNGSGACHSHSPLLDNVELIRISTVGPQWAVRDLELFQDTFAEDGTINPTSTGRADCANDINHPTNPAIQPGDSSTVRASDPENGLAPDPHSGFGAAVYTHVAIWPRGQTNKEGNALSQDVFRYPVVGGFVDANGTQWTTLRMDTSFTNGAARTGAQPDAFAIDLNDNLFTVGDTICFVFSAENATGDVTYFSWGLFGSTPDMQEALDTPSEFQILPGGGYNNGGDILYVDGNFPLGFLQDYFDTAFEMIGIADEIDRYDVRAPSSGVGNRIGSRVQNVFQQLIVPYRKIIWDTGALSVNAVSDGNGTEKTNDAYVLFTFLDQRPNPGGVYFSGDNAADQMYNKSDPGIDLVQLTSVYINGAVNSGDGNHNNSGFGTNPIVVGEPGSAFDHTLGPDHLIAYGGCPGINDFDVITPTGAATLQMNYGGAAGQTRGAVIGQVTNNTAGADVRVLLSGFSFYLIADVDPSGIPARVHHMHDILQWLQNTPPVPTGGETPVFENSLSQNYPNPFNPQTAIVFTVRERTSVTLRVYNVAGQLVRTLVDDVRTPGILHTVEWSGRNDAGQFVSSGVYFYRLMTKDFTQTRKMVLLK